MCVSVSVGVGACLGGVVCVSVSVGVGACLAGEVCVCVCVCGRGNFHM